MMHVDRMHVLCVFEGRGMYVVKEFVGGDREAMEEWLTMAWQVCTQGDGVVIVGSE
jgi:hypothetical protein